jgi:hypothetical protein
LSFSVNAASLLTILSNSSKAGSGGRNTGGGGMLTAANGRGRNNKGDLEQLQLLHSFFSRLVDDMAASVQRLALQDFNQWLVRAVSKQHQQGHELLNTQMQHSGAGTPTGWEMAGAHGRQQHWLAALAAEHHPGGGGGGGVNVCHMSYLSVISVCCAGFCPVW